MNDLPDLLDDASQPDRDWLADPHALLAEGRHRVRRRRLTFVGGAAAAVVLAVSASAVVAPRLMSDPEPAKPKDKHSSLYVEQRIPVTEVERRCNHVLGNPSYEVDVLKNPPRPWLAGIDRNGRAVRADESAKPVENRVGHSVQLAREGDRLDLDDSGTTCLIPQEGVMGVAEVEPAVALSGDADFAAACSGLLGYDVAGWQRAAVAKDPQQWQAVFVSANGYAAQCAIGREPGGDAETWLHEDRYYDNDGQPIVRSIDRSPNEVNRYSTVHPDCSERGRTWTYCRSVGMLSSTEPDVTIELTLPDGRVETVRATRGGFAYSFRIRTADLPPDEDGFQINPNFPTRILTADGELIWEGWQDQDK